MSWMAFAARSFQSAVRAWPSSSMQVHTTAAPYSRASVRNRSRRVPGASPSSRLTELRMARPPIHCSAVQHRVAELLRPVGVGALADRQVGEVLLEGREAVDRGGAVLVDRGAGGGG